MHEKLDQMIFCGLAGAGSAWLIYMVAFILSFVFYCGLAGICTLGDFPNVLGDQLCMSFVPAIIGFFVGGATGLIKIEKRIHQLLVALFFGTFPGVLCGCGVFMVAGM